MSNISSLQHWFDYAYSDNDQLSNLAVYMAISHLKYRLHQFSVNIICCSQHYRPCRHLQHETKATNQLEYGLI